MKKRHTEEQVVFVLKQAENRHSRGGSVQDDGNFLNHFLHVKNEIRRYERNSSSSAEAVGGSKTAPEAFDGRSESEQQDTVADHQYDSDINRTALVPCDFEIAVW